METKAAPKTRLPEPWLRGPMPGIPNAVMPVFHSFAQVREDLRQHISGMQSEKIWRSMQGGSLGFHLKHLAGSVDRLTTYLVGRPLSEQQLAALTNEGHGNETAEALLQLVDRALEQAEAEIIGVQEESFHQPRTVGRQELPTTVFGLLVHLAEHTQRHLGQSITLSHILRQNG